MTRPLLGGVELGGTKCIAVVGAPGRIADRLELPTGMPAETLSALASWLAARGPAAIGVASFGPVALDRADGRFGRVLAEIKRGWRDANVVSPFSAIAPVRLDTDVAAAALAEARLGAAREARLSLYLTVGTGIGGAWVRDNALLHAQAHPELGHIRLPRRADGFEGVCALHGDCVEGLASGPAIAARAGADAASLPVDHPALQAATGALGALVATLLLALPADAVVLGGGVVTGRPALVPRIADACAAVLGGYPPGLDPHAILQPAGLGRDAGPVGALLLAQAARPDLG